MKIGIDISQVIYKGTGVARYIEGMIESIIKYDFNNQWTFFFSTFRNKLDSVLEEKISKKGYKIKKYKIPARFLSILWNDLHKIDIESFLGELDFFISSDWTEPPSKIIKKATVVHDLGILRYPQTVAKNILTTQKKRLAWVKKESAIIFADSQTTKDDLMNFFHLNEKKITVIYPGVDVIKPTKKFINKIPAKYSLTKPFILTVGKIEPRKNLKRLIQAFQQLNNNTIDLVIVGPKGWEQFSNLAIEQYSNIHLLGYIEDNELFALYSSCLFFVYPSIWEGFGYPIVEAMRLGAPVTTSNNSSLKEIAEDSALFFDPFDTNEIKKSLEKMINDKLLREKLSQKGKERGKFFTWENYYNKFIKVLTES